jgi:hypothetical protein
MNSNYIIDPSDAVAGMCYQNGHFLEDDYYTAMTNNEVPDSYWKQVSNANKSERKIVIVGSHDIPMKITKSAFIALTLAKPKKLTIKSSCADETVLLKKMFVQNQTYNDCEFAVYHNKKDELASNVAWLRDIEDATDVVVFGGLDTLSFFGSSAKSNQNLYFRKPKFSFGIVTRECLEDEDNLVGLVGDFLTYFGEGSYAPRFYITLGSLTKDQLLFISDCMHNERDLVNEFRAKLPWSKKTMLLHEKTYSKFEYPYIRKSSFDSPEFLMPLFGDIRLIQAKNENEIEKFLYEYEEVVSTIALQDETAGDLVAGLDLDIPRYCDIGSMQFPFFYENFDEVDELEIFNNNFDSFEL